MTYVGTTAASSVRNPPVRIDSGRLSQRNRAESTSWSEGGALWTYSSSNKTTTLTAAAGGFFTDGALLGMRNGDIIIAGAHSTVTSTGDVILIGLITGVSSTADSASISTEGFLTSTATEGGGG